MEIGPGNAKGARKAIARIEQIAHDRHAVAAHMLEQLRRTMLAQRQHRGDLETWIHGALHPMQLPAALERREKGAHALVAHGGAIRSMPLPLSEVPTALVSSAVMRGLVPRIHVFGAAAKTWMAGPSPGEGSTRRCCTRKRSTAHAH